MKSLVDREIEISGSRRRPRSGTRTVRAILVVALVVLLGACDWVGFHNGADHTGFQPYETAISAANVGGLAQARTYATNGATTAPVIANGVLYVATNTLYAFDATGANNCSGSPTTCTPLWTAPAPSATGLTVYGGTVFVTLGQNSGIRAYDAAGSTNCTTMLPKTCQPLWSSGSLFAGSGFPVVANGVLYVAGFGDGIALTQGGAYVLAYDASGSTNCTITLPKTCSPIWTTNGPPVSNAGAAGAPTIVNGVLYLAARGTLLAYDAAGSMSCSGAPKVCAPLWTGATPATTFSSTPAVANGTVYLNGFDDKLYAYDATGTTNCTGTPIVCQPLWTAATSASVTSSTAVANGVAYVVSTNGMLTAFDATGAGPHCSGTPKTCSRLWASPSGPTGQATSSSPAVANGVVYFSSTDGGTYAYDATGTTNCTGTPTICTPLWSAVTGRTGGGSPAVANGVVYVNVNGNATVYAYALPPAPG